MSQTSFTSSKAPLEAPDEVTMTICNNVTAALHVLFQLDSNMFGVT